MLTKHDLRAHNQIPASQIINCNGKSQVRI